MADQKEELKLIRMNEVDAQEISWLWYPYIPFGKITVIQGDPGDGKTTVVLAIAAAITTGATLPESDKIAEPMQYQVEELKRDRDKWKANYTNLWNEVKEFISAIRSMPEKLRAFIINHQSEKSSQKEQR